MADEVFPTEQDETMLRRLRDGTFGNADVVTIGGDRLVRMANQRDAYRDVMVRLLCSQGLADHLGDVRDAESAIWNILGIPDLSYDDPAIDSDSAFTLTAARLKQAGIPLPAHLQGDEDDEDG